MFVKNLCIKLHSLASAVTAVKIILIYMLRVVRKENLNMYTRIGVKSDLKN